MLVTARNSPTILSPVFFVVAETFYVIDFCHFPVMLWVRFHLGMEDWQERSSQSHYLWPWLKRVTS